MAHAEFVPEINAELPGDVATLSYPIQESALVTVPPPETTSELP